jgi:hypothetical protein
MRDDLSVRTTLDIADDVLQAAKEIADARRTTAGRVLSDLARQALSAPGPSRLLRNGVPLLPRRPPSSLRPTMKLVNSLRDDR